MRVGLAGKAPRRGMSLLRVPLPPGLLPRLSLLPRLGLLAVGLALGGCQTDGAVTAAGGQSLAFDSIDGPPKATFEKLVGQLASEAEARRMPVVSRNQAAAYRVKGYLAVHVEKGKGSVAYAWDVYDGNKARVARVVGEETVGQLKGADRAGGWAACDDAVLARIADQSMSRLAETLGMNAAPVRTPAEPSEAAPRQAAPASPAPADAPVAPEPADPDPGTGAVVAAQAAPAAGALAFATE